MSLLTPPSSPSSLDTVTPRPSPLSVTPHPFPDLKETPSGSQPPSLISSQKASSTSKTPSTSKSNIKTISPAWKEAIAIVNSAGRNLVKEKVRRAARPKRFLIPDKANDDEDLSDDDELFSLADDYEEPEEDDIEGPSSGEEDEESDVEVPSFDGDVDQEDGDVVQSDGDERDGAEKAQRAKDNTVLINPGGRKKRATKVSRTTKCGIQFSVSRVEAGLRHGPNPKTRLSRTAPVYLAAVLEYMVAEILEIGSDICTQAKRKIITPRHLFLGVKQDFELDELLKDVIIADSGVEETEKKRKAGEGAGPQMKKQKVDASAASKPAAAGDKTTTSSASNKAPTKVVKKTTAAKKAITSTKSNKAALTKTKK